ncbi:MAG: hypothetical protein K6E91_11425 [Butyrivibrio sp.]|nr:hypothetical protein [Butyrivibrio sp.]
MVANNDALNTEHVNTKDWYNDLLADVELNSTLIHDKENGKPGALYLDRKLCLDAGKISEFENKLGISSGIFYAGAYGYLLSCFSGSDEALYAFVTGNGVSFDNTGAAFKTVPVLERFKDKESIGDHLLALDKQIKGSLKNDSLSFDEILSQFNLSIPTFFIYHDGNDNSSEITSIKTNIDNPEIDDKNK